MDLKSSGLAMAACLAEASVQSSGLRKAFPLLWAAMSNHNKAQQSQSATAGTAAPVRDAKGTNMNRIILTIISAAIFFWSSLSFSNQSAYEDDIQDFNKETGIGCTSNKPVSEGAEYYFICLSKRSADAAWNAALYRGKLACNGKNFSVYFNVNPKAPAPSSFYGAQVELSCAKKP